MNPAVIGRHTKSARLLVMGAAAALTVGTVLASGAGPRRPPAPVPP